MLTMFSVLAEIQFLNLYHVRRPRERHAKSSILNTQGRPAPGRDTYGGLFLDQDATSVPQSFHPNVIRMTYANVPATVVNLGHHPCLLSLDKIIKPESIIEFLMMPCTKIILAAK
jgi:hypothetical protein